MEPLWIHHLGKIIEVADREQQSSIIGQADKPVRFDLERAAKSEIPIK
jgi:hypothetical protein